MANFANITKNASPEFASGGYKNVLYFAPRSKFTAIAAVMAYAALGDEIRITADHTFAAGDGFYSWALRLHSPTITGQTVGDDGAQEIEWTASGEILGDSASTQVQMQNLLNEDGICLLKDAECTATKHWQLGNDCVSPSFKVEFDGKTTKEGKKVYKITMVCKKKYSYEGAVTVSA